MHPRHFADAGGMGGDVMNTSGLMDQSKYNTRRRGLYNEKGIRESALEAIPPPLYFCFTVDEAKYLLDFRLTACAPQEGADWHTSRLDALKGRTVIIIPEYSAEGVQAGEKLAAELIRRGAAVAKIFDVMTARAGIVGYLRRLRREENLLSDTIDSALAIHQKPFQPVHRGNGSEGVTADEWPDPEPLPEALQKVILDYRQLLQAEIPERKMILTWFPEGSLAMVYAPRGLGKTFFGLSLAASISSGGPFMRWPVAEPCGVLYIDGEMALLELRKRITGFLARPPEAPLLTLSHEIFYQAAGRDLNITDEEIQKVILAYLDENPLIRVLIVDNLSALTRIREDKSDDWRESFFPFIMQCRRRRVAVLLVHHAGKNGDQRGTGAREDALDITIKLSKTDEYYKGGAYFRVDFTKARGVFGDTVKPFTAKLVKGAEGCFTWTLKDVEEDTETRLVKLIEDTGGISVTDAAEEIGVTKSTISKVKKRLIDKGILKKTPSGTHAIMELAGGV